MSDDPKEPEAEANDSTQPDEEEGPKRHRVSEEKLKDILAAHEKWLESGEKKGKTADLQGVNLQEADLSSANLKKANLANANLQEADLIEADLREANLHGANLLEASLIGADLHGTYLFGANLQGADLRYANLKDAYFNNADLQGAHLSDADLHGAKLLCTNLHGADLTNASLYKAKLGQATLREAILQDADLREVTGLLGEQLAGTNVSGAKLPDDIAEHAFDGAEPAWIVEVMRQCGFASSNGEARRLMKAGAVSIEGEKVTEGFASFAPDDLKGKVLKVGKHQFRKIV